MKLAKLYYIVSLLFIVVSCTNTAENVQGVDKLDLYKKISANDSLALATYQLLEDKGLVDLQTLNANIGVDLRYADTANFTKKVLYSGVAKAYLQKEAAQKLAKAQDYLMQNNPTLRLLVYDAVRPVEVQQEMWEAVQGSFFRRYVADPARKSLHNYGAAVDLTLADSLLNPLDMGTPFDYFGKKAAVNIEPQLLSEGLLTAKQVKNRQLLRNAMVSVGFHSISGEWWHFNSCSLSEAKQKYILIESFCR